jgi:hypothetical protein
MVDTPRRSPYSGGKAVATPEQLQHYFDMFASPAQRAAAAAGGGAGGAAAPAAGGYGQQADQQGQYDQGDGGASPLLPLGRDAPLYRPSIVSQLRLLLSFPDSAEGMDAEGWGGVVLADQGG